MRQGAIAIEVSPGELLDRLTILEIKLERLGEPARHNVEVEWRELRRSETESIPGSVDLQRLRGELRTVNEKLWDVEDALRVCERRADFGNRFVELARSVYRLNDERTALKRRINTFLGSPLQEEKSYGVGRRASEGAQKE
jgi:hypothetical protein